MIGAEEFINNISRYCLWLVNASPTEIRNMPQVLKRVEQVRTDRLSSSDKQAQAILDMRLVRLTGLERQKVEGAP